MRIRKANQRRRRAEMRARDRARFEHPFAKAMRELCAAFARWAASLRPCREALERLGDNIRLGQGGTIDVHRFAGMDLASGPDHSAEFIVSRDHLDRFEFEELSAAPTEIKSVRVLCRLPRRG
jgi:hypothetical protein